MLAGTLAGNGKGEWDGQHLEEVLRFTGGHPRLTQFCLQKGADTAERCEEALRASPLPGQLYSRFRDPAQRREICGRLRRQDQGPFDLWPADDITRALFWNNLLGERGGRLHWRCGFVQRIGREMLGCG